MGYLVSCQYDDELRDVEIAAAAAGAGDDVAAAAAACGDTDCVVCYLNDQTGADSLLQAWG